MVEVPSPLRAVEKSSNHKIKDAAQSPHQIDDGIGFRTQGFRRDIRHHGDRRGTVSTHYHQQDQQDSDKGAELP